MALKDVWKPKVDGVDDVLAEHINAIAEAVIKNEEAVEKNAKDILNKVEKEPGKDLSTNDYTD